MTIDMNMNLSIYLSLIRDIIMKQTFIKGLKLELEKISLHCEQSWM